MSGGHGALANGGCHCLTLLFCAETKAWEVDTLRGHTNNVSCVMFHARQVAGGVGWSGGYVHVLKKQRQLGPIAAELWAQGRVALPRVRVGATSPLWF